MRANRFALIVAAGLALPAAADTLEPLSRLDWETDIIVGISGIEIEVDGLRFTAIGDRGFWLTGQFERTDGRITDIAVETVEPILGYDGFPVAARRVGDWSDAEGLAIAPDGRKWISFERWTRVALYANGLRGKSTFIKEHETFQEHADNWQLEATALAPDGTLYAFSEKPLLDGFPVYRLDDEGWTIAARLPEQDLFAIVGADFDINGDLYLLERKLIMGFWWQSRIRRINLEAESDEVLWTSERGDFDNLEGLAVWRQGDALILTAVSDNNGTADTPTEFVEFRLIESPELPLDENEPEG